MSVSSVCRAARNAVVSRAFHSRSALTNPVSSMVDKIYRFPPQFVSHLDRYEPEIQRFVVSELGGRAFTKAEMRVKIQEIRARIFEDGTLVTPTTQGLEKIVRQFRTESCEEEFLHFPNSAVIEAILLDAIKREDGSYDGLTEVALLLADHFQSKKTSEEEIQRDCKRLLHKLTQRSTDFFIRNLLDCAEIYTKFSKTANRSVEVIAQANKIEDNVPAGSVLFFPSAKQIEASLLAAIERSDSSLDEFIPLAKKLASEFHDKSCTEKTIHDHCINLLGKDSEEVAVFFSQALSECAKSYNETALEVIGQSFTFPDQESLENSLNFTIGRRDCPSYDVLMAAARGLSIRFAERSLTKAEICEECDEFLVPFSLVDGDHTFFVELLISCAISNEPKQ